MKYRSRPLKILDFDIENRPLSYWIPLKPSAEITAIAWSMDGKTECVLLGKDDPEDMLKRFVAAYDEADMVTGHYIRMHDLPIINGALAEYGLVTLKPKLVSDTRVDMIKKGDIAATQENLADMLGLKSRKVHMTQALWREANRLTPEGIMYTKLRVMGDVMQHMELRKAMIKAGWLGTPQMWYP